MSRFLCKAFVDDDGRYVGIDHGGAKGVFEASDEHRLVDEGVQRTTQPAPFGAKIWPIRRRHAGDDQHLEIRTMRFRSPQRRRKQIGRSALAVVVKYPNRSHAGGTISSAGTAGCGSRAPPWPTRRPRPRLPSGRPSGAGRDSREILRSPRSRRTGRRTGCVSRSRRTRLSRRPPGSASDRLSRRVRRKTDRSGGPEFAFRWPSLSPARVCRQEQRRCLRDGRSLDPNQAAYRPAIASLRAELRFRCSHRSKAANGNSITGCERRHFRGAGSGRTRHSQHATPKAA